MSDSLNFFFAAFISRKDILSLLLSLSVFFFRNLSKELRDNDNGKEEEK